MGLSSQSARKKLEAVARYWAGDRDQNTAKVDRNVVDGLIAMCAPAEIIAAAQSQLIGEDDDCEVWPENWQSVTLFLALSTQWNVSPAGSALGINYVSIESIMRIFSIKKKKRMTMFDDIRLMELAALSVLREKAERESCRH